MKGAIDINPPATDLVLLPIAGLDYRRALEVWTLFNVVCLAAATLWLQSRLGFDGPWRPGFIALVLLDAPVFANFLNGQFYVFLLVLLMLAWYSYKERRDGILGMALGLMLVLKLAGGLLLLMLLVQRRRRAVAWAAVCILAVIAVPLPWLPFAAWRASAHALVASSSLNVTALTDFQTLHSFCRHLFTYDARYYPAPLLNARLLATTLISLGIIGTIGITVYCAWKVRAGDRDDVIFSAFVTAGLILTPASLEYHFTLLLLPIALLAAWGWRRGESPWWYTVLGLTAALLAAPLPYRSPRFDLGAWALAAYPRLYGAYLLWGLSMWICLRRRENLT